MTLMDDERQQTSPTPMKNHKLHNNNQLYAEKEKFSQVNNFYNSFDTREVNHNHYLTMSPNTRTETNQRSWTYSRENKVRLFDNSNSVLMQGIGDKAMERTK